VYYLPEDNKTNAWRFLEIVQPSIVFFVKYEFWYHFLTELKSRKIPVFLIAAIFRNSQPFFKWYGHLHRQMLGCFKAIFVQNENSLSLLKTMGIKNAKLVGDPRIDRVLEIAGEGRHFPEIARFCGDSPILVAGSTWPKDEELLHHLSKQPVFYGWKMIIAPHDTSVKRIQEIQNLFGDRVVLHSEISKVKTENDILLVDSIGYLAWLYQFGRLAYIGGGFGRGIHNTLEPMAFHLPVLYGPRYGKFAEAVEMTNKKGHFPIRSNAELLQAFKTLADTQELKKAQVANSTFMNSSKDATKTIVKCISGFL
jgi:3-deoxy-D-manno-octulosonic-acid transferase